MVPHEHHGSGIIGGCSIVLLLEVAQEVLLALQDDMARWVARGTWEATTPECDDDTCLTGSYVLSLPALKDTTKTFLAAQFELITLRVLRPVLMS